MMFSSFLRCSPFSLLALAFHVFDQFCFFVTI